MKFNQESFDENDGIGRQLLTAFLKKKCHNVLNNSDKYGIDLVSEKDGVEYKWEVEMKSRRPWTCMGDFAFKSVSFLNRKAKWKDTQFWYVIICSETRAALFCRSDIVFDEQYKEKLYINTSQRKGTDEFYRVPKELCIFVPPNEFTDER
jgi:hypothetical protein